MAKRKEGEVELLVNGAGLLAAFWTLLVSEVEKLGGTAKDLHRLVTPEGTLIIKRMAALIVGKETEVAGDTIIRVVPVNYTRTPKEAIKATHRAENTDDVVVKEMPVGGDGTKNSVEVVFFNLGQYISDADLAIEYEKRGLKPDPYAVAAVNEADPLFADEHPNSTHWQDKDGNWCFAGFSRGGGERDVVIGRNGCGWIARWWFGGVRK